MSSITYNDCKDCPHIHKKYLSEEKLAFNASCGLCIVKNDDSVERVRWGVKDDEFADV